MTPRKIGMTIVTTMLAVFVVGHVRGFLTHGQFDCAAAAAQQSWNGGGAGDSEADEVSTEPEKAPPSVSGDWSGTTVDAQLGSGFFDIDIDQSGTKLSGTWDSKFSGGTVNFTGSINRNGKVKFNLNDGGHCHLSAVGMLVGSDEISCTYKVKSCSPAYKHDTGTIKISR